MLGFLAVLVGWSPTRQALLDRLDTLLRWWDDRWERRLAAGEQLLRSGRTDEAVDYLARLDRIHPAISVRHARDKERTRLLKLLGRSYEAAGRTGLAMATYQRLVAFDSLNYLNHFELARAAERLLSGWALAPEARDGYAAALKVFPAHLPSVRGYIDYYQDRGEFREVVAAYRAYLDAHFVHLLRITTADTSLVLPVLVDGRARDYEVGWPAPIEDGKVTLATDGFSLVLSRIEVVPAARVGRLGPIHPVPIDPRGIATEGFQAVEDARLLAVDSTAAVRFAVPTAPITALRLRLGLFKPIDVGLWQIVARSFQNLLDDPGLRDAASRTVAGGTAESADRVLSRLGWAREGLLLRPDERPF